VQRAPIAITGPPAAETPVERLLRRARRRLSRLEPREVEGRLADGAVLVDIRPEPQRVRDGEPRGAVVVCRNVLEWRCDLHSPWREERLCAGAPRLILICDEGCQSSLAAAALHDLGRSDATDVVGGFRAWVAAGLPVRAASPVGLAEGAPELFAVGAQDTR